MKDWRGRRVARLEWALKAAHDTILMFPGPPQTDKRGYRIAAAVLDNQPTNYPDDPDNKEAT